MHMSFQTAFLAIFFLKSLKIDMKNFDAFRSPLSGKWWNTYSTEGEISIKAIHDFQYTV